VAEVISFKEGVRSVRKRRQQDLARRCAELIELNLRLAIELYGAASEDEKPVRARHVRQLAELLEYVERQGTGG
jgi:hypothetical protein